MPCLQRQEPTLSSRSRRSSREGSGDWPCEGVAMLVTPPSSAAHILEHSIAQGAWPAFQAEAAALVRPQD